MPVFNDGKMRGERLPPCTIPDVARLTCARVRSEGFHLLGQIAKVFGNGLIEKIVLLALQRFTLPAELDSAQVSQFKLQFFDDEAIVPDARFKAEIPLLMSL